MSSFKNYINFDDFDEFNQITETESSVILTSQKYFLLSKNYIFKIFQFECLSTVDQKIILDTFYNISKKKNQYIRSYNYLSFSYESKYTPTFSMKYLSSKTLEHVLRDPDLLTKLTTEKIIQCLFAVAEGMSYLHNNLIYHGNLCPSNIIVDDANQFYIVDFGLYPIKKIYIKTENLFNNDYKDPQMKNNQPTFINDIYSYGVLMCDIYMNYLKATNKIDQNESLSKFLKNHSKNKFDIFPSFCIEIIPLCLNSILCERPSFKQIIKIFKNANKKVFGVNIQQLYKKFIKSNYIFNLADSGDSNSLNKIGRIYEKEKNLQKALLYYEKAANLNNSEAQNNYGVLLQEIDKKNKANIIKGAHYLQLSAEQGNIYGMANYGMALLNGDGIESNFQKAEEYLHKSADLGYSYAQLNYGCLLLDNNPTVSAIVEGLSYIKKAMNQNNQDAFYTYGTFLKNGKFVEKDNELAMKQFKIAADMGHEEAIMEYADGNLNENKEIALKYYQLALDKGIKNAKEKFDNLKKELNGIDESKKLSNKADDSSQKALNINNNNDKQLPSSEKTKPSKNHDSFENNDFSNASQTKNDIESPTSSSKSIELSKKYLKTRNDSFQYYNDSFSDDSPKEEKVKAFNNDEDIINNIMLKLKKNIPIKVSSQHTLISIGEIVYDKINYHNAHHIFPVGYICDKEFISIHNPCENAVYRCSILDGGDCPIFRVECLDESKMIFEEKTAQMPWNKVKDEINNSLKKLKIKNNIKTNIGLYHFGLYNSTVKNLIQNLPNVELCENYIFKKDLPKITLIPDDFNKETGEEEKKENFKNDKKSPKKEQETNEQKPSIEIKKSIKSEISNNNIELNLSAEQLIQKGDLLFEQNDLINALKYYKEAVKHGQKDALLKCSEASQIFEEKLKYLEQAIKKKVPKSFSKWRITIMRRGYLLTDNSNLLDFAKRFENFHDFSDAAIMYNKAKDILNSKICSDKAKSNIENIKDGYQQYDYALYLINQKEIELAIIMLQKSIENNCIRAEAKLKKVLQQHQQKELDGVESLLKQGIDYYEGRNGIKKDLGKSMVFFEKASKNGCPKADYYIGCHFKNEYGLDHLKSSAEAGDPDGQAKFAYYLQNGILTLKNRRKALHYYKLAADQGHAEASFAYGKEIYENGTIDEELKEGIAYLKRSAESLYPDAIYMYSKIIKETNPEDSKKFFDYAIEKGSKLALKSRH